MYEERHLDNGVVIGSILLCLKNGEILKHKDLNNIIKNINLIDSKKGAQICLNPEFIEEETSFYKDDKIFEYNENKDGWLLLDRKKAEAYCGHFVDKTLKTAVSKTFHKSVENNLNL